MSPSPTLDQRAGLDFVLALRQRWADTLYPAVHAEFLAAGGDPGGSLDDAAAVAHRQPIYPWFAWLERGSQKMLWRTVTNAVTNHAEEEVRPPDAPIGSLSLDPALALPDWYTAWDIHVQPGGIWRNKRSAQVYELGAQLVMLGQNDDYAFHRRFVETAVPDRPYLTIVDLGCGFGKSTWPFKRSFPNAGVIGLDLAAPCLELAHAKAEALGLAIDFRQRDCRDTGLADASCDLVTATMLVHELPTDALAATLQEAARILAPGGLLRVLDFHNTGDAFRDLAMTEHGVRNNEPFMPELLAADTIAMCDAAGLESARWLAFDERGTGRLDTLAWPERREWHFPWAVLEAERPE